MEFGLLLGYPLRCRVLNFLFFAKPYSDQVLVSRFLKNTKAYINRTPLFLLPSPAASEKELIRGLMLFKRFSLKLVRIILEPALPLNAMSRNFLTRLTTRYFSKLLQSG